jgi:lipoate-protein ligase A
VIRRFSGGGTVVVDESTLFVTFIVNHRDLPSVPAYPEPIHRWTADFYASAWKIPGFTWRENDYAIGDKKVGGNAQYIRKGRWLHHTSFLWDYRPELMNLLLLPKKQPSYRLKRSHTEFLTPLKNHAESPSSLIASLLPGVKPIYVRPEAPSRQATRLLDL